MTSASTQGRMWTVSPYLSACSNSFHTPRRLILLWTFRLALVCICVLVCIRVYMCVNTHVHIHIYISVNIRKHTCVYIYTLHKIYTYKHCTTIRHCYSPITSLPSRIQKHYQILPNLRTVYTDLFVWVLDCLKHKPKTQKYKLSTLNPKP